ncbi:hypothetical protein PR048_012422 [Dryococelus australis]|uniref:Uncharacterized protein n=1 Tax=Dryococelus australis TaxID=614101 RepID=A0ABQ9HPD5_9NEOP|nr:hypothetical protein PR048_012422 [Dryococelus australis]
MKSATEEVVTQNNDRDLTVALDGSWHHKGHVSLHGVVTCTSVDTGKVADLDILLKHCTLWDAVASSNDRNLVMCHVYERLGFPPVRNCVQAMKRLDSYRKMKQSVWKLEDIYEQQEDPDEPSYGAGMY